MNVNVQCNYSIMSNFNDGLLKLPLFYTPLQRPRHYQNHNLYSQKVSHISPSRASYGVSIVIIVEKINRTIIAPYWTLHISIDIMYGVYDDVTKWRYWLIGRGIHQSPVNPFHKGQWRGALMFSFICAWTNGWVDNRDAGDLRRYCARYDVTVRLWEIAIRAIALRQPQWQGALMWVSWSLIWVLHVSPHAEGSIRPHPADGKWPASKIYI